ncbi:MAG: hypothetical protein V4529_13420 [Gemmatimonadota bacterium]
MSNSIRADRSTTTGSCSRNDETAGAARHTASSSFPSITGACSARVATAVLLLLLLLSLTIGGADCCARIAAGRAVAKLVTSHAHIAESGPRLLDGADSTDCTNLC